MVLKWEFNFFIFAQENVFRFDLRKLVALAFAIFTTIAINCYFFERSFAKNNIQKHSLFFNELVVLATFFRNNDFKLLTLNL